jgi:hypothetical protein
MVGPSGRFSTFLLTPMLTRKNASVGRPLSLRKPPSVGASVRDGAKVGQLPTQCKNWEIASPLCPTRRYFQISLILWRYKTRT